MKANEREGAITVDVDAALKGARAYVAKGWRPGLSIRLPDGSIEWSAEGALRGELFRQGVTDTADQEPYLQQALAKLGAASFDQLEKTAGRGKSKAEVLASFDAAAAKAAPAKGKQGA
jgi:hypothetical protein